MAMFLVTLRRSGPEWDNSKSLQEQSGWADHAAFVEGLVDAGFIVLGGAVDDERVVHAIEAASQEQVQATLAQDPWAYSHLRFDTIEAWDVRLDGTRRR